jgi:hypothetical protein
MLLSKEYYIKTAKKYRKVYNVMPTFKETFLLFAKIDYTKDCLAHIDLNG